MGSNDPDSKLEWLERWSGYATLIILAGIVTEIAALWWPLPWWSSRVWSTIADALIGIGLIAEYIVIRLTVVASGESKAAADLKVAESNRLAKEAQLELEKLKAPRSLNVDVFVKELEGKPKWPVVEILFVDTGDCLNLAVQINMALHRAKWASRQPKPLRGVNPSFETVAEYTPVTTSYGGHPIGITVVAKERFGQVPDLSSSPPLALMFALGMSLSSQTANGDRESSMRDGTIRIVVAPKQ